MNFPGEADKESVLDDADDVIELSGDGYGGEVRWKCAVENVMTAIADEWLSIGIFAQRGHGTQRRQLARRRLPAEGNYLHRNGESRGEVVHEFAIVDDDRQSRTCVCHNLFAE